MPPGMRLRRGQEPIRNVPSGAAAGSSAGTVLSARQKRALKKRLALGQPVDSLPRSDRVLQLGRCGNESLARRDRICMLDPWHSESGIAGLSLKKNRKNPVEGAYPVIDSHLRGGRLVVPKSSFNRTSPPAAKLGAGVEKSPGPSFFMPPDGSSPPTPARHRSRASAAAPAPILGSRSAAGGQGLGRLSC